MQIALDNQSDFIQRGDFASHSSWNNFSPARMGTFKRFSAGVIGQVHISL